MLLVAMRSNYKICRNASVSVMMRNRNTERSTQILTVQYCHCTNKHAYKAGIGCFSDDFIKRARSNCTAALFGAETDADKFARTMRCLGEHYARNEHEWEGGHCQFHPLKHCSCGKCSGDKLICLGKLYKAKSPLTS